MTGSVSVLLTVLLFIWTDTFDIFKPTLCRDVLMSKTVMECCFASARFKPNRNALMPAKSTISLIKEL
jgi:hypothetical protein